MTGAHSRLFSHPWGGASLLRVWIVTVVTVAASQLVSFAVYPNRWEFFYILPAATGAIAITRLVFGIWTMLWQRRPFEAVSVTVVLLALGFTLVWLGVALVRVGLNRSLKYRVSLERQTHSLSS